MYIPEPFRLSDRSAALAFVARHPFATLVSHSRPPRIGHAPIIAADEEGSLFEGHLARANPLADDVEAGADATAIFLGPHGYVSPTWYSSPGLVPTWNFTAVHVSGRLEAVDDRGRLAVLVESLADRFERNRDDPWVPDYAETMLDAIIGFRLQVESIEAKFKLSQNRGRADRDGVIRGLASGGGDERELAALMRALEPEPDP